jgi:uncharacterized phiE125 gp8 family phage protein
MPIELTRPTIVTGPTIEPLTLAEAKKQCELSSSDTAHDDHLSLLIQAAREQWEHDTDSCCMTQTLYVNANRFSEEIELPTRPITSITSIQYYDDNNTLQTVSASVYSLNPSEREIELQYQQTWPTTTDRWDAVKITYVAGYANVASVPAIHKAAMRLLVGHYFENRDMLMSDAMQTMRAYEALVNKFMRSSYP